jgi:hypothetical protein
MLSGQSFVPLLGVRQRNGRPPDRIAQRGCEAPTPPSTPPTGGLLTGRGNMVKSKTSLSGNTSELLTNANPPRRPPLVRPAQAHPVVLRDGITDSEETMWKVENVKSVKKGHGFGPFRLRDPSRSQSSPNSCPGGGRKSGLSVAVRMTIQIEDALFLEARYVPAMTQKKPRDGAGLPSLGGIRGLSRDSPDEPQTGVDFCAVAAF